MSVFLVGGLLLVVGATWTIIYNAPLLLGGLAWAFGHSRSLAPVVRLSIAYPLRSLFRTGVTLAMFMLVVFTLVVGTTISGSFIKVSNDLELFGAASRCAPGRAGQSGSSDRRGRPRGARGACKRRARCDDQAIVPLEPGRRAQAARSESYPVAGLDDAFLSTTTYGFAAIADGYDSASDVWRALRERSGLAVVDSIVAPGETAGRSETSRRTSGSPASISRTGASRPRRSRSAISRPASGPV